MEGEGSNPQPSILFSEKIYEWLDSALDYGITEHEFWNMTIAELERAFESKKRMLKLTQQERVKERASFDYILAELIGRSVGRIYNSSNEYPKISDIYPTLFDAVEVDTNIQEKKDELSALRFRQFASFHNRRYEEVQHS